MSSCPLSRTSLALPISRLDKYSSLEPVVVSKIQFTRFLRRLSVLHQTEGRKTKGYTRLPSLGKQIIGLQLALAILPSSHSQARHCRSAVAPLPKPYEARMMRWAYLAPWRCSTGIMSLCVRQR